jgi:alpha-1,6-mannosyltransferase
METTTGTEPGQGADWPPGTVFALGATGMIGMALIAAGGVFGGPVGETNSIIERSVIGWGPQGTAGDVAAGIGMTIGLVAVFGAWIMLGLLLRRGAPLKPLWRIATLWSLPLLIGPPLYSRDVYSYAALGRMVNLHFDPYYYGPAILGGSPYLEGVGGAWLHTSTPYGPLFLGISSAIVRFAGNSVFNAVLMLRLVEVLGLVLIAVGLPKLAIAAGKDPARAVWLGVCNPLILLHFIGGAHNDALMVGLIVAGLAAAVVQRPMLGVVLCLTAAAIKAPAAVAALFIIAEAVRAAPRDRRLITAAKLFGAGTVTFTFLTWVSGVGWGWIGSLTVPGNNRNLLTPTTFVAKVLSLPLGHEDFFISVTRGLGMLATIAGVSYLLWRAPRLDLTRAVGLALAVVVAFGPVLLPWYALWAIILLAAAGRRIERGYAIFASVLLAFMVQPSGSSMPDVVLMATVVVLSGAALAIAWTPVRRWIREDLAVAIDEYRRNGEVAHIVPMLRRAKPAINSSNS